jgi:hypothetical protein
MATKEKQVVQYRVTPFQRIVEGDSAFILPLDHPDTENVSNGTFASTSTVLSYNPETGDFETKNTRYVQEKVAQADEAVVQ